MNISTATATKYGAFCHRIALNILSISADADECVSDTYLDESYTPDKIAEYSVENGYYVEGTGTSWFLALSISFPTDNSFYFLYRQNLGAVSREGTKSFPSQNPKTGLKRRGTGVFRWKRTVSGREDKAAARFPFVRITL